MKTMIKSAAVLVVLCFVASPAMANVTFYFNNTQMTSNLQVIAVGYAASNTNTWGLHNGGAFTMKVVQGVIDPRPDNVGQPLPGNLPQTNGAISGLIGDLDSSNVQQFNTFCIEPRTTNLNFGTNFRYVATMDTYAVDGNAGAVNGIDQLSAASAWVYRQYLAGSLAPLGYDNEEISEALWMLEGDGASVDTIDASSIDAAKLKLAAEAAVGSSTDLGGVYVLNLWTLQWLNNRWEAVDIQSQVVAVPAPGAALLVVAGLGIVGWVKRRLA